MQTLDEKFVSIDRFGVPVSVNYRGFKTYKTRCGACCSIGYYLIIIVVGLTLLASLVKYENTFISVYEVPLQQELLETESLNDYGVTLIWDTEIQTSSGKLYQIPEKYGRVVIYRPQSTEPADSRIGTDQLISLGACATMGYLDKFESAAAFRRASPQS